MPLKSLRVQQCMCHVCKVLIHVSLLIFFCGDGLSNYHGSKVLYVLSLLRICKLSRRLIRQYLVYPRAKFHINEMALNPLR